jgi:hypothetical protein
MSGCGRRLKTVMDSALSIFRGYLEGEPYSLLLLCRKSHPKRLMTAVHQIDPCGYEKTCLIEHCQITVRGNSSSRSARKCPLQSIPYTCHIIAPCPVLPRKLDNLYILEFRPDLEIRGDWEVWMVTLAVQFVAILIKICSC